MKKSILILSFAVMAMAGISLTSCSNSEKPSDDSATTEQVAEAKYQCPMKCEGDKTYDKPGKCPKCGMDLKEVEK